MISAEGANARSAQGRPPVICARARANEGDIEKAWEAVRPAAHPRIHTFLATSPIHMEKKLRMAPDEVVDAIRRVAGGEMVVAPAMTIKMIGILQHGDKERETHNSLQQLTDREREILQLLAGGESNKAIAITLGISNDTVKQHVRHILNKLNLTSRVEAAVMFAVEQNNAHGRGL